MIPTLPPLPGTSIQGAATTLPNLLPGITLNGLVLAPMKDGMLRLQVGTRILELPTEVALAPGTRVALTAAGEASRPTLTLQPLSPAQPQAPTQSVSQFSPQIPPSISGLPSRQFAPLSPEAARSAPQPGAQNASPVVPASANAVMTAATAAAVKSAVAMIGSTAARQGGLAPLYANLTLALGRPDLPSPVVMAARLLLALRVDVENGVTAPAIKSALMNSGLVATAPGLRLAAGSGDIPGALQALRQALQEWAPEEESARLLTPMASTTVGQTPARASDQAPPLRGVPTLPQAPAPPSLLVDAPAADVVRQLSDATDAALARQILLQVASLPDDASGAQPAAHTSGPLTFDIPLATALGTAVVQLRIERDDGESAQGGAEPAWRVSFAIDLEPIGLVHARIALVGNRAAVSLTAERGASAERLVQGLPLLEAGLRDAALEPGQIACHVGVPRAPAAAPGLFLDHAS